MKEKVREDRSNQLAPVYQAPIFERRFIMSRKLFNRIFSAVSLNSPFIISGLRLELTGPFGASSLQTVVASPRYIAHESLADSLYEYCCLD